MPFPPQASNGLVQIWLNGQATLPPGGPPDIITDCWTGKPKIALNEWQYDTFGRMFYLLTVGAEYSPFDPIEDPNGIGSTLAIALPGRLHYYQVLAVWPVMFENETQYVQCLIVDRNYV